MLPMRLKSAWDRKQRRTYIAKIGLKFNRKARAARVGKARAHGVHLQVVTEIERVVKAVLKAKGTVEVRAAPAGRLAKDAVEARALVVAAACASHSKIVGTVQKGKAAGILRTRLGTIKAAGDHRWLVD